MGNSEVLCLDRRLSDTWNAQFAASDLSQPEHMWQMCRLLAASGLCLPNDEDVSLTKIGPFRIARPADEPYLSIFFDMILPGIIATHCANGDLKIALAGVLPAASKILCTSLLRSCQVGDELAWHILLIIEENAKVGLCLTIAELQNEIRALPRLHLTSDARVLDTLESLQGARPLMGTRAVALVEVRSDGKIVSKL